MLRSLVAFAPWNYKAEASICPDGKRLRVAISLDVEGVQYVTAEDTRYISDEADYVANAAEPIAEEVKRPDFSWWRAVIEVLRVTIRHVAVALAGLPLAIHQESRILFLLAIVAGPLLVLAITIAVRRLAQSVAGRSQRPWALWLRRVTHCTLYLAIQPDKTRYDVFETAESCEVVEPPNPSIAGRLRALAERNKPPLAILRRSWKRRVLFIHLSGFPSSEWSVDERVALERLRASWRPHEIYLIPSDDPVSSLIARTTGNILWAVRGSVRPL
jgi:hypothetical protein